MVMEASEMELKIGAESLALIWDHLCQPHRSGRTDGQRTAHKDVIANGWGISVDIQDILWETDDRADAVMRHSDAFDFLLAPFQLQFVSRYPGPFSKLTDLCGHKAMRAADIATFVMEIERLGFSVDAEAIAAALRPSLIRQKYLTNSEVSVAWYKKQRHLLPEIVARVESSIPNSSRKTRTHSGYTATALFQDDSPVVLRVDPPRNISEKLLGYWIQGELQRAKLVQA